MGLIDTVNRLNNTQTELLTEKQRKEKEKEKNKLDQKRYLKIKNYFILYLQNYYKESNNTKQTTELLLKNKQTIINQIKAEYFEEFEININIKKYNDFVNLNYYNWINAVKKEFAAIEKPPDYKTIIYNGIERQYKNHGINVYYTLEEGRKNFLQKFDIDTYQMNEFYKNINNKFYKQYKNNTSCLTFKNISLAIIGGFTFGFIKEFKKNLK